MKKGKPEGDEMRAEYRPEDLGPLVRGKYAARYAKSTNVVVIDPSLTCVVPESEAVNDAIRSSLTVATTATRLTGRSNRTARKRSGV